MPTMRKEPNLAVTLVTAERDYKVPPCRNPVKPRVDLPELFTDQDPSWRAEAACVGSTLNFLPNWANTSMINACKKVCATCPVTEECLQMALETEDKFSICGGYTYKERLALKR
jgi:WhiB family redox-sensing transcriptional regulator